MKQKAFPWLAVGCLCLFLLSSPCLGEEKKDAGNEQKQTLEERVEALEFVSEINAMRTWVPFTGEFFKCGSDADFRILGTRKPGLSFFVKCENIEPNLEGPKITIKIGNPYYASFSNFEGTITYAEDYKDFSLKGKKTPFKLRNPLEPGTWNPVTVTINPSSPQEMRVIHVELGGFDTVGLKEK